MSGRIELPFSSRVASLGATLLFAALSAVAANADAVGSPLDKVIPLNVARQTLDGALRALAKQANLQIVFNAALVSGRTAPVVNARTTPRLVIDRWLSGTNLIAEEQSRGVIVVRQDGRGRKGKSLHR
jgi:hypothetical protein